MKALSVTVPLTLVCSLLSASHAWCSPRGPVAYGLPERSDYPADINKAGDLYDRDRKAWTEMLLWWIADQVRSPSPTQTGLGGGPITSGYILKVYAGLLAKGDSALLCLVANDQSVDRRIHDLVVLALGISGDARRAPDLRRLMAPGNADHVRALAARGLGSLCAREARAELERVAREDPYVVRVGPKSGPPANAGTRDIYPVRDMARQSLRVMDGVAVGEKPPSVTRFEARIAEGRKDLKAHRPSDWLLKALRAPAIATPTKPEQ